jgi:hypothetical protein
MLALLMIVLAGSAGCVNPGEWEYDQAKKLFK